MTIARDFGHGSASAQIARLRLEGRAGEDTAGVVSAERALVRHARALGRPLLDITYADTKRFPAPTWALEAFMGAASGGGPAYTPYRGDPAVCEHVARALGEFLGMPVDPETELLLTPGTQAGVFVALAAILEPGDRVVLGDPEYLAYERLIRFLNAEVDHVALEWSDGAGEIDPDALRAAISPATRCIVLSNPNNPTGAVLRDTTLRAIAELAIEHDLLVIVDELYARLLYDRRSFTHLAALEGMAERTITLTGPSKTESMSGYRVGVARAPAELADAMEDVLSVTALRAPAYAQSTLVHWLRDDAAFIAARIAEYERLRDMTVARIRASPALDVEIPGGTAYAFPRLTAGGISDQAVAIALMDRAGVIVNPGYQFGPTARGSFRICFAQEESAWEAALERIVRALELPIDPVAGPPA